MMIGLRAFALVAAVGVVLTISAPAAAQRGPGGWKAPPGPPPSTPARTGEFGFTFPEVLEAINRGQARPALAFYERVAADAEASKVRPDAARAHAAVAWVAVRLAMYQKAIRAGTRALELMKDEPATAETVSRGISTYSAVGSAYRFAGDPTQARRYFEEGLAFAQAHPRLRGPSLGVGVLSRQLAALAFNQGDFATAEKSGLEAGQFFEAFLAQAGPRVTETVKVNARQQAAEAFMLVARAQLATTRPDDAEVTLTRARGYARLAGATEQEVDLLAFAAGVAQARKDQSRRSIYFNRPSLPAAGSIVSDPSSRSTGASRAASAPWPDTTMRWPRSRPRWLWSRTSEANCRSRISAAGSWMRSSNFINSP